MNPEHVRGDDPKVWAPAIPPSEPLAITPYALALKMVTLGEPKLKIEHNHELPVLLRVIQDVGMVKASKAFEAILAAGADVASDPYKLLYIPFYESVLQQNQQGD